MIRRTILAALAACLVIAISVERAPAQVTEQPEKKAASTIRGIVTYADTGRPMRFTNIVTVNNDTGERLPHSISDGRGQFVMQKVPAGRYILYVNAPGILAPSDYERNMGPVTSQLRLNQTRDVFTEVVVNGTDAVDVKVQGVRGGVITGRVVTEDDQPVPGAGVKLLKRENDEWIPVRSTWGTIPDKTHDTDLSGVYRVAGLHAGEYIVRVSESDTGFDGRAHEQDAYFKGSLMVTYYPAATNLKEAQAVSVVEGSESTGIDIRMPDRIPRTLSGTLTVGANDKPAAYVEVLVESPDESGFGTSIDRTTGTDEEGKWVVRGIPAGQYVVRFGGSARGTAENGEDIYLAPKHVPVTVGHADVVLNARVVEAAVVSGRVKFVGPKPQSLYPLRPAVVPATAGSERSMSNEGSKWHREYRAGYVRDEGWFEIRALAAGKYSFVMSGFEADRYYVKSVTRKGVDLSQKVFTLEAGTEFGDVLVTLGTDMASIEGQVSDTRSKAASGEKKTTPGELIVILAPANDATRRFSPGLFTSHSDDLGRFNFSCGPGEYFVVVFTRAQREKLTTPITEDFFRNDNQKFLRVKVRAGEKLKGLTLPIGVN